MKWLWYGIGCYAFALAVWGSVWYGVGWYLRRTDQVYIDRYLEQLHQKEREHEDHKK